MDHKSYVIVHMVGEERFETILWATAPDRAVDRVLKAFPGTDVQLVRESRLADVRRLA